MPIHKGTEGKVIIGGSGVVGSVRSFSVEETVDTLETTTMGDTARTYDASINTWTGSFDIYWDEDDAGQSGVSIGSQISISFRPEGNDSGDLFYSGTGIITSVSRSASFDGLIESSVSVQGKTNLSQTEQP